MLMRIGQQIRDCTLVDFWSCFHILIRLRLWQDRNGINGYKWLKSGMICWCPMVSNDFKILHAHGCPYIFAIFWGEVILRSLSNIFSKIPVLLSSCRSARAPKPPNHQGPAPCGCLVMAVKTMKGWWNKAKSTTSWGESMLWSDFWDRIWWKLMKYRWTIARNWMA